MAFEVRAESLVALIISRYNVILLGGGREVERERLDGALLYVSAYQSICQSESATITGH